MPGLRPGTLAAPDSAAAGVEIGGEWRLTLTTGFARPRSDG
jgi:hypothetical protein